MKAKILSIFVLLVVVIPVVLSVLAVMILKHPWILGVPLAAVGIVVWSKRRRSRPVPSRRPVLNRRRIRRTLAQLVRR